MMFCVSHEVLFEITVDASSRKDAEQMAAQIPYTQWQQKCVVREESVALAESPVNPRPE